MDDYMTIDPKDTQKIGNLLQGDDVNQVLTTTSLAIFCFFPSQGKLSSTLRGLMLAEMTFLLKFIDINYPQNLREYFYERANFTRSIFYTFKFQTYDDDDHKIPALFKLYRYSPYFLDNAGDMIFQNIIILSFSYIFLLLDKMIEKKKKEYPDKKLFNVLLKGTNLLVHALVWGNVLATYFSTFQQIFFYMICSCVFTDFNDVSGRLNFSLVILSLFFRALIIIYIFSVVYVCQNFRVQSNIIQKEIEKNQVMNLEVKTDPQYQIKHENLDLHENKIEESVKNFNQADTSPINGPHEKKIEIVKLELPKENFETKSASNHNDLFSEDVYLKDAFDMPSSYKKNSKVYANEVENFFKNQTKNNHDLENLSKKILIERYALILIDYKINHFYQKYYILIDLLRLCVMAMIVSIFYEYSLFQIISMNLIEWIFIITTLINKPFNSMYSTINFIFNEIFIVMIFLCCLIIRAYDDKNILNYEGRINLGWTMIYCNFSFRLWILLTTIGKIVFEAINDINQKKKCSKNN